MATSNAPASKSGLYADPREDWLAQRKEEILESSRPIVDPHHHLWDRGGQRYMIEEMAADIASGHNIIATVYVDCRSMYRASGPEAFRPVGEVEFANGVAAMSASGGYGPAAICAGIVSHVNLLLGEGARPVLEAEITAGQGRFRGIRHSSAWDAEAGVAGMYATRPKGLLLDPTFRKGFSCLAPLGLSFDAWLFHPQIAELTNLARAFPDTKIVLDHCGGPVGRGRFANRREETLVEWKASIQEIAKCPNVVVKLGGLAMCLLGYDFHERPMPPSSEEAAAAWRPYIETCIEEFSPERCMFESNFPPDKGQCSYQVIFNAFKRIAAPYSETEKTALFSKTAMDFYKLRLGEQQGGHLSRDAFANNVDGIGNMIGPTQRLIESNGIRLNIAEQGEGPLVLLCHGFPESWYSWRHQIDALAAAGFHAVAPDMRGYGKSDRPEAIDQYTMFHLVGDLVGLLDALKAPTAVVVGHDWGAGVAWQAARLRPDRFRAVACLSVPFRPRSEARPTSVMPRTADAQFYQLYFQEPGVAEAELERDPRATVRNMLFGGSGEGAAAIRAGAASGGTAPGIGMVPHGGGFLRGAGAPATLPAWLSEADIDFYAGEFKRSGFRGPLNYYRNIDRNWELLAAFEGVPVTVPALYVAGDRDMVVSFPGMDQLLANFKRFVPALRNILILPGCGHWTQQERPSEVNAAIIDFIRSLPN